MRKVSFALFLFLFISFGSQLMAQGMSDKGITGGLNMAKFIGSDAKIGTTEPSFYLAYTAGVYATFGINEQLGIRPEILYSVKGSKYEESESGTTYTLTFKLNYLEVPVLAVYSLQPTLNLLAGGYFGYYLSGKIKAEAGGNSDEEDIKSEDVNGTDYGLVFGAEYVMNTIKIGARYSMGLSQWPKDDTEEVDAKNSVIQVLIGFSL